jgi:hypothetical protein
MKIVCPCCATGFPIEAGLIEADAKRLGKLLGDMEPAVARAAMSYMRFFKPAKQELRVSRAVHVLTELAVLISSGRISKDERTGMQRPCGGHHWVQGIEQMLTHTHLELPLKNHNYLRAIVFKLADGADAKAEQQQHKDLQQQRRNGEGLTKAARSPLDLKLELLRDWKSRGFLDTAAYDQAVQQAHAEFGGSLASSLNQHETTPQMIKVKS